MTKKLFLTFIFSLFVFAGVTLCPTPAKAAAGKLTWNNDDQVFEIILPKTGEKKYDPVQVDAMVTYLNGDVKQETLNVTGIDWSAEKYGIVQAATVSSAPGTYDRSAKNNTPYKTTISVRVVGEFPLTVTISTDYDGATMGKVEGTPALTNNTAVIFYDTDVTLNATPYSGYAFSGWYDGNTLVSSSNPYSFPMPPHAYNLTAKFEPQIYTITLDAKGGNCSDSSIAVVYNRAYNMPDPTRKGYTFKGWYSDETFSAGTKVEKTTILRNPNNHTLYAKWQANVYKVGFDANTFDQLHGGITSKNVTYDTAYGTLPTASRDGFTFLGWKYGTYLINENTILNFDFDHDLVANWVGNNVTIYLDPNGGTVSVESVDLPYQGTYKGLPTPVWEGYRFEGWLLNGLFVDKDDVVTTKNEHTLKAHWSSINEPYKDVIYDNPYGDLPEPLRNGYDFAGWFTMEDSKHFAHGTQIYSYTLVQVAKDHWLYARWVPKTFTVSFDSNGGTPCSPITVRYDAKYGALPVPEKEDCAFVGWFTAELDDNGFGTEPITDVTPVKILDNQILYAAWAPDNAIAPVTVTFDPNGGTVSPTSKEVEFEAEYGVLPLPRRTGYNFIKNATHSDWMYNGHMILETDIMNIAFDHTLTARWTAKEYSVNLDGQGAEPGYQTSVKMTYDQKGPTITNLPIKNNNIFLGYFTEPNGAGDQYYDANGIGVKVWQLEEDGKTLYACWKENKTIIYDANGGHVPGNTSNTVITLYVAYNVDSSAAISNTFVKTGYLFSHWNTKADGSGITYQPGDYFPVPNDVVLYAQWNPIQYFITYDYGDGNVLIQNPTSAFYDQAGGVNIEPPLSNFPGMGFTGWNIYNTNGFTGITVKNTDRNFGNLTYINWDTIHFEATYDWSNSFYQITFHKNPLQYQIYPTDVKFDIWEDEGCIKQATKCNQCASLSNTNCEHIIGYFSTAGGGASGENTEFGCTFATTLPVVNAHGATFLGWNTKPDASGTMYTSISEIPAMPTMGSLELYAIWGDNISYTITPHDDTWVNEDVTITTSAKSEATGIYRLTQKASRTVNGSIFANTVYYPAIFLGEPLEIEVSDPANGLQSFGHEPLLSNDTEYMRFNRVKRDLAVVYTVQGSYEIDSIISSRSFKSPYNFSTPVENSNIETTETVLIRLDKTPPTLFDFSVEQDVLENHKAALSDSPYGGTLQTVFKVKVHDDNDEAYGLYLDKEDSSQIKEVYLLVRDLDNATIETRYNLTKGSQVAGSNAYNYSLSVDLYKEPIFRGTAKLIYELYATDNAGNTTLVPIDMETLGAGEETHNSIFGTLDNFCVYAEIYNNKPKSNKDDGIYFQTGESGYIKVWTYGYVENLVFDFNVMNAEAIREIELGELREKYLLNRIITLDNANCSGYFCNPDAYGELGTAILIPTYYPLRENGFTHIDGRPQYDPENHFAKISARKSSYENSSIVDYIVYDVISNDYHYHLWPME